MREPVIGAVLFVLIGAMIATVGACEVED